VGKCEGRKRGVQAEIVLHLLEYTSEGKTGTELAVTSTFNLLIENEGKGSGRRSKSPFFMFLKLQDERVGESSEADCNEYILPSAGKGSGLRVPGTKPAVTSTFNLFLLTED